MLFARFMRFYPAYTFLDCLAMRARQFFALNKQISVLMKEEEIRALTVHHHGKPGDRVRELISSLRSKGIGRAAGERSSAALIAQGDVRTAAASDIDALRERQKETARRIKEDRAAWLAETRQKIANDKSRR